MFQIEVFYVRLTIDSYRMDESAKCENQTRTALMVKKSNTRHLQAYLFVCVNAEEVQTKNKTERKLNERMRKNGLSFL